MLKYTPEEYNSLNLTKNDSENMKNISEKAAAIIRSMHERTEQYLDENYQEHFLNQAKEILEHVEYAQENVVLEAEDIINDETLGQFWNEPSADIPQELDETSEVYSSALKGSRRELFFQTVIEELPELQISLDDVSKYPDHFSESNTVVIKAVPHKTNRAFLYELEKHPVILFLKSPSLPHPSFGKTLEEYALLPEGVTERILVKAYQADVDYYKKLQAAGHSDPILISLLRGREEQLAGLAGTEPITEAEIKEIMRTTIQNEYRILNDPENGEDQNA